VRFPPSPVCPKCLSAAQSWKQASGKATLESWGDFHRAYLGGFNDALPYRVCLVRLEEGPLLVSNLVGESATAKLGAAVRVVFEKATDDITLLKFVLARAVVWRVPWPTGCSTGARPAVRKFHHEDTKNTKATACASRKAE
jgi:hypothetical protein